jgi:hypothetical protein
MVENFYGEKLMFLGYKSSENEPTSEFYSNHLHYRMFWGFLKFSQQITQHITKCPLLVQSVIYSLSVMSGLLVRSEKRKERNIRNRLILCTMSVPVKVCENVHVHTGTPLNCLVCYVPSTKLQPWSGACHVRRGERGVVHEDYPTSLNSKQVQACLLHEQLR